MKLLFLSTAFPQPGEPGLAPFNLRLCEALAVEHEVTVISPVPWTRAWRSVGPMRGLDVHYPTFVYPPRVLRSTHDWWLWRSVLPTVRHVIERAAPDVVISYWTWPDGAAAAHAARACGAPVVMMVGGSDVLVLARRAGHRRRVARTLAQAAAVVPVCEHLRRQIVTLGVPPERIAVVQRGVDGDIFSPGSQADARVRLGSCHVDPMLLWVGRLSYVKGPDLLLDALEQLTSAGLRRWRCTIVGDGPLRHRLMRRVERGALAGLVTFIETLPPRVLADWYRAADALVISSRSEGVPNVLYEAKACGTPVVATNVGDVSTFVDEQDRVVPAGDTMQLAAAIAEVLSASPQRSRPRRLPTWRESAAALEDVLLRVRAGERELVARPVTTAA